MERQIQQQFRSPPAQHTQIFNNTLNSPGQKKVRISPKPMRGITLKRSEVSNIKFRYKSRSEDTYESKYEI